MTPTAIILLVSVEYLPTGSRIGRNT